MPCPEYANEAPVGQEKLDRQKYQTENSTFEPQSIRVTEAATAGQSDKLIGSIIGDNIRIESLIGQGGMSVVYQGRHLVLDRKMAVKVLLPNLGFNSKAVLRLQQEAKAAYSLSHENLASVHDVSTTSDGLPYLIMDFAEGETLSAVLKDGPMDAQRAIEVFSQMCAGLRAAHTQGVIHRDIKPGNVMVEELADGGVRVKVVDFGIAKKVTENADEIQKLTQTGEVFGTPLYMSPEQCRGDKIDERSDVYSIGCVLYEAVTGAPPFVGQSSIATIMMHLGQEAPEPPKSLNLPRGLVNVIHKCLEKDAANRYQSMDELYRDLQRLKGGEKTSRYSRKKAMNKGAKAALIVTIVALIGGSLFAGKWAWDRATDDRLGYENIELCNEKLARNPDDFKAYFYRGKHFCQTREYTKAIADFTDALRVKKDSAFAHAQRAHAYYMLRKYDQAIADCNAQIALEGASVAGYHNRADAYFGKRDYRMALADAQKFLDKYPGDYSMQVMKARALLKLNRLPEATQSANAALSLASDNSEAYKVLSLIDWARQDLNSCRVHASEAIRQSRDPEAYYYRALALFTQKRYEEAVRDVDTILTLLPDDPRALRLKANFLLRLDHPEDALTICNQLAAKDPDNYRTYAMRATVYKKLGKMDLYAKDKAQYEKLKSAQPANLTQSPEPSD
ncbi:MAG: protein kinase [Cyanobacteria bacterium SZAS TMP-1]|nr:protein kinase [Cyanobacteria bacterium SZAS TMP-1]